MTDLVVFDYQGAAVAFDPSAKMWNLNAMHQAAGGLSHKRPHEWMKRDQTREFIEALARKLPAQGGSLVVTREGRSGGTWAHWQLAAAYAHYLNPEFYIQWNEWAMERATGQEAPSAELAALEARVAALEGRRAHRQVGVSPRQAKVLDALREMGGQGRRSELADLLNLPRMGSSVIDTCLARMVRRGLVRRTFYGIYELPA